MAPRKVRLIVDLVRGLTVAEAEKRLQFQPKAAALPVLKLLRSAVANAEHNFKLDADQLFIKTITADGGPALKRMRPRAMGRGVTIKKRTTHVNIILSDEKAAPAKKTRAAKPVKKTAVKPAAKAQASAQANA